MIIEHYDQAAAPGDGRVNGGGRTIDAERSYRVPYQRYEVSLNSRTDEPPSG